MTAPGLDAFDHEDRELLSRPKSPASHNPDDLALFPPEDAADGEGWHDRARGPLDASLELVAQSPARKPPGGDELSLTEVVYQLAINTREIGGRRTSARPAGTGISWPVLGTAAMLFVISFATTRMMRDSGAPHRDINAAHTPEGLASRELLAARPNVELTPLHRVLAPRPVQELSLRTDGGGAISTADTMPPTPADTTKPEPALAVDPRRTIETAARTAASHDVPTAAVQNRSSGVESPRVATATESEHAGAAATASTLVTAPPVVVSDPEILPAEAETSPAPAAAPAAAPPRPVAAASPLPGVRRAAAEVEAVVARYAGAISAMDETAVREVWPAVDLRALTRAFRGLHEQALSFDRCDVVIRDRTASAACSGTVRYVPKVGSRTARSEGRRWNFTLERDSDRWVIATVESR